MSVKISTKEKDERREQGVPCKEIKRMNDQIQPLVQGMKDANETYKHSSLPKLV